MATCTLILWSILVLRKRSSNACCCLCCSRFDTVSSVKKRKLLYRPSARTECSILKSLIEISETLPFAYPRLWRPSMCDETNLYRTTGIACVTIKQYLIAYPRGLLCVMKPAYTELLK